MAQQVQEYAVDDWVVHLYYGVGQIKEIDVKPLNGEEVQCYRVKTENSTFWVPVDQADNPRLRPIASQEKVKQVIEVFKDAPNTKNGNGGSKRLSQMDPSPRLPHLCVISPLGACRKS